MDRSGLEENVVRELEALRQRLVLLSDVQLSGLLTFLRAVIPPHTPHTAEYVSRRALFDGGRSTVFEVVPGTGSGVL